MCGFSVPETDGWTLSSVRNTKRTVPSPPPFDPCEKYGMNCKYLSLFDYLKRILKNEI
jgi:hypothetical protein